MKPATSISVSQFTERVEEKIYWLITSLKKRKKFAHIIADIFHGHIKQKGDWKLYL